MNKEEAKIIFGENLKRLRTSIGMSQEELAKALGYTNRSSINKIELGKNDMPRNKVLRAAQVLGVNPLQLFEGAKEAPSLDVTVKTESWLINLENELTSESLAKLKSYAEYLKEMQDKGEM